MLGRALRTRRDMMAKRINVAAWASDLTRREGGKVSLPVGQVSEVLKLVLDDLARLDVEDVLAELTRRRRALMRRKDRRRQ